MGTSVCGKGKELNSAGLDAQHVHMESTRTGMMLILILAQTVHVGTQQQKRAAQVALSVSKVRT